MKTLIFVMFAIPYYCVKTKFGKMFLRELLKG